MALAILTTLASCTLPGTTPAPVAPAKQMTPDAMMQKEAMPKVDTMMKDDKMMTGTMDKAMTPDTMQKDTMMKADEMQKAEMTKSTETMMKPETMVKSETNMTKETGYMQYDAAKVQLALASGQRVALFFHASWCPSCRALDKAITSDIVPSDAIIFQVDYDTSTELKKQYRVITQHTTVVLNADGSEKMKKLGARTVAEVLGQ